ncbi:thiamine pyrophosphate-dependent enzyme [uncultured Martelella sp.]|uniref:thiamine pyrophosphate-dependent enzyme n=1 Tax=uncultured Martelella sp. TaxID=392331 RepID=UPI0029C7D9F2|nr:thiamine pyrophosphate-dependent enzyme [uncultured Martelella sp.]
MLRDFQSKKGGTVLQPNGGGGMGYAIPSAMAAALHFPGRRAVAVLGDGGFTMSLHSLVSAVELGLDLTVVVLDNTVLGWVYNGQRGRVIASEFKAFDYPGIAASIGTTASSVDTLDAFEAALEKSLTTSGVSVIIASVSKADRYQDIMASINTVDTYAVPQDD